MHDWDEGGLKVNFWIFGHFFRNRWSKVSDSFYDGRRQEGKFFEYVAIFEEKLNMGLITGLDKNEALLGLYKRIFQHSSDILVWIS